MITGIDLEDRKLTLSDREPLGFGRLVYAAGSRSNAASVPGAAAHAHTLDTAETSTRLAAAIAEHPGLAGVIFSGRRSRCPDCGGRSASACGFGTVRGCRGCPSIWRQGSPGARTYGVQRVCCKRHLASFAQVRGHVGVWAGAGCKTVGSAYVGSNPTPATSCENGPPAAETRPGGPLPTCHATCQGASLWIDAWQCVRTYGVQRPDKTSGAYNRSLCRYAPVLSRLPERRDCLSHRPPCPGRLLKRERNDSRGSGRSPSLIGVESVAVQADVPSGGGSPTSEELSFGEISLSRTTAVLLAVIGVHCGRRAGHQDVWAPQANADRWKVDRIRCPGGNTGAGARGWRWAVVTAAGMCS
jgi:hypothetical protein